MSPTFSDSVFSDIDDGRTSRVPPRGLPASNLPMDNNRLFVPIKKKRPPSPPGSSPDRISDPGSYASGAKNRLVDFDLEPRTMDTSESYSRMQNNIDNLNLVSNTLTSTETGARPKTQTHTSLRNDRKGKKNVSNIKIRDQFSDDKSRDLFMPKVTRDSGLGSSTLTLPIETVDNPSEQQSTNVDEARFSAALSLFDPLTESSSMSGGDLLEGAASPPGQGFVSFKNPAYCESTIKEPLIPVTNPKSVIQFKYDIPATDSKQNGMVVDSNTCDIFGQPQALPNKRRGSSDSNRSSGSSLSKDGSASGMDNSLRHDDKVIINSVSCVCLN